jgi:hypothetical protein
MTSAIVWHVVVFRDRRVDRTRYVAELRAQRYTDGDPERQTP